MKATFRRSLVLLDVGCDIAGVMVSKKMQETPVISSVKGWVGQVYKSSNRYDLNPNSRLLLKATFGWLIHAAKMQECVIITNGSLH